MGPTSLLELVLSVIAPALQLCPQGFPAKEKWRQAASPRSVDIDTLTTRVLAGAGLQLGACTGLDHEMCSSALHIFRVVANSRKQLRFCCTFLDQYTCVLQVQRTILQFCRISRVIAQF